MQSLRNLRDALTGLVSEKFPAAKDTFKVRLYQHTNGGVYIADTPELVARYNKNPDMTDITKKD